MLYVITYYRLVIDIVLREFRLEDLDDLYALTLQSKIIDYLTDWICTRQEYERRADRFIKRNKYGYFKWYKRCKKD